MLNNELDYIAIRKELDARIQLALCAKRLQSNSDFKRLVQDGFITRYSQARVESIETSLPEIKDWVHIKAPYVLREYLVSLVEDGSVAESELEALNEEFHNNR